MKTFAIPVSVDEKKKWEQEVREFVREWIGLLANQKYSEALALLSPEVPQGSGSLNQRENPVWTPTLLEAVIANYGTPEPLEGTSQIYAAVPLYDSLHDEFERRLLISLRSNPETEKVWLGGADFDLPLNYARGNGLGDLTVRLLFKPLDARKMAVVLLDIHVL